MKLSTIMNINVFPWFLLKPAAVFALLVLSLISCSPALKPGKGNVIENQVNFVEVNQNNVLFRPKVEFQGTVHGRKKAVKCRGIDACLRVCEHLGNVDCKSYPVGKVLSLWKQNIGSYTEWESFKKDLEVIATDPGVSFFLKSTDKDNTVLVSLLKAENSLGRVNCPFAKMETIDFSYSNYSDSKKHYTALHISPVDEVTFMVEEGAEGAVSETAGASVEQASQAKGDDAVQQAETAQEEATAEGNQQVSADAEEAQRAVEGQSFATAVGFQAVKSKTIVNSQVAPFDVNIFAGFIKQCFGHNQRTFSQMAAEIENRSAVDIGHKALFKGCGGNGECIRFAYCVVGSDRLWSYVSEDIKAPGCEYDSFASILSPEPEAE